MRILWLKTELLHPLDKGGRIRSYQMLTHIKREHEVTYLSFVRPDDSPEALERSSEYCQRLITVPISEPRKFGARFYYDLTVSLASPLPYAIQKYRSREMRRAIELETRERNYDVVVCDFLATAINLPRALDCAAVLFQHNVESMIWRRHFETQRQGLKRAFLKSQWRKMLPYERETCRGFDAVIAVSDVDRDQMRKEFGIAHVYDVPTGVDTSFFSPVETSPDPFELVFTGSMDWIPNQDAILYFADKILPIISRQIPECRLTVVGRNPGAALLQLERSHPRIKVTGRVEDIRPYVARAAAYIVPIRIGGGTRLKIYEAMAMGKPVISTSVGAEGLPVRDEAELLLADEPQEFARAVLRVLGDGALARRLGENARAVVCEKFGWDRAARSFTEICDRVAGQRAVARQRDLPGVESLVAVKPEMNGLKI
jgi:sugar transferase (PEP-CTERM/EpsH1 system associated)